MKLTKAAAVLLVLAAAASSGDAASAVGRTTSVGEARGLEVAHHAADASARELQIPGLDDILDKLLGNLPQELKDLIQQILASDDIANAIDKIKDLLAQGKALIEEILASVKDGIANGLPDALVDKILTAIQNKVALDADTLAQIHQFLKEGATLPATLEIPGVADLVDKIKALVPENILDRVAEILANANTPELKDIIEAIKDALQNGLNPDAVAAIVDAVKSGTVLDAATVQQIESHLGGRALPKTLVIPGLQDLLDKLPAGLLDKIQNLLDNAGVANIEDLVQLIKAAVANGIPEDLLDKLLAAASSGAKLDSATVAEIERYLATGQSVPQELVAPTPPPTPLTEGSTGATAPGSSGDKSEQVETDGSGPSAGVIFGVGGGVFAAAAGMAAYNKRHHRKAAEAASARQPGGAKDSNYELGPSQASWAPATPMQHYQYASEVQRGHFEGRGGMPDL